MHTTPARLGSLALCLGLAVAPMTALAGDFAADGILPEAAMPDAAMPDAAMPDAAMPDAAMPGAAVSDDGTPDADAGMDDPMTGEMGTMPVEPAPGYLTGGEAGMPYSPQPPYAHQMPRFTMTPVKGGILRLDTVSGDVSVCREKGDDWVCTLAADDRAAYEDELGRLIEENTRLSEKLAALRDGQHLGDATQDDETEEGLPRRFSDVPLSKKEEKELDRVLGLTEKAMRGFIGLAKTLQREFDDDPGEAAMPDTDRPQESMPDGEPDAGMAPDEAPAR